MPQQLVQTVRRGRKPGKNYFEEKQMVNLVQQYKQTNNQELYNEIYNGFKKIAIGMINKYYNNNSLIRTMYKETDGKVRYELDDAVSNCICEIFKSLNKFDVSRGRLFSYANKICKNTLYRMSKKNEKLVKKETIFTNVCTKTLTEDDKFDETGIENINASKNNETEFIEEETLLKTTTPLSPEPKNVTIKCKESLYIIYKYICYIYGILREYSENLENLENLVNDIKFDGRIKFSFDKYYNNNMTFDNYKELLFKINKTIESTKNWLETEYSEEIKTEPKSYDGYLSSRALQKIRKYFKTNLKKSNELKKFDINDLIGIIEFAIVRFEETH